MKYQILNGDNRVVLKTIESNSIDAIVTDPPYGIDFLGKSWDANTGSLETYRECLRVLKPGGHLLAFSAARTYHHLAITLEQAGFEIRDQIMWIYSSGFPKSQDVGKSIDRGEKKTKGRLGPLYTPAQGNPKITACEVCGAGNGILKASKCQHDPCPFKEIAKPADNEWAGWGTALKPAHEPICLARKPIKVSIAKNCQKWGTGALNIDAGRIPYEPDAHVLKYDGYKNGSYESTHKNPISYSHGTKVSINEQGRFPSNVIGEIDEPYQKYFYCPKVSRAERHTGYDLSNIPTDPSGKYDNGGYSANQETLKSAGNNHPTVKPVELMKYLIKLVTPPLGRVLDPFNGSGSTGMAAVELGYEYIGIEQDDSYCEISRKRIAAHFKRADPLRASGLFD